jgi:hypothetical protein
VDLFADDAGQWRVMTVQPEKTGVYFFSRNAEEVLTGKYLHIPIFIFAAVARLSMLRRPFGMCADFARAAFQSSRIPQRLHAVQNMSSIRNQYPHF